MNDWIEVQQDTKTFTDQVQWIILLKICLEIRVANRRLFICSGNFSLASDTLSKGVNKRHGTKERSKTG